MLEKVLFLTSHFGSGYEHLYDVLNHNPRIQGFYIKIVFSHPDSLQYLVDHKHKNDTTAAIYMTHLLINPTFTNKELCKFCKFIYLIRPPYHALHEMTDFGLYRPQEALNYYMFRLQRITQLAKLTPGAVFLTYDDMARIEGYDLIESYLNLKTPLERRTVPERVASGNIHRSFIDKGDEAYRKYLRKILSLDLQTTFS